jgi:hypothetical protein
MFNLSVSARDTPRSVARVHEFLNERQMQVRNIDEIDTGLDCFYHTLRLGVSNNGNVMDTMAQLVDGQPQHEVSAHTETAAGLRRTAERTIRWILNSTATGFQLMKENLQAFIEVEAREHLGPNV